MAIAAVPNYLGENFSQASPAMRFGQYLAIWGSDWKKQNFNIKDWRKITQLNKTDKQHIDSIIARQKYLAEQLGVFSIEAEGVAPFVTGLGNEHPTENGFAFLNPYGIPYLPGSGVKGVLRQAAVELVSGEWGDTKNWSEAAVNALFGYEAKANEQQNTQGVLQFWDVIPEIKTDHLAVEIMTPHYSDYYQGKASPHDSGQPNPIFFLAVPAGSAFNFYIHCNQQRLAQLAPELLEKDKWQELLTAAMQHAFDWLGFGAKTAVGYGAMQEDQRKKDQREQQQATQREQERRATLSPEDLAYEENAPMIASFAAAFEKAKTGAYQPGQEFDSKRNDFVQLSTTWTDKRSRKEAAELLNETMKWGVSKKGKERLKDVLKQLRENQG